MLCRPKPSPKREGSPLHVAAYQREGSPAQLALARIKRSPKKVSFTQVRCSVSIRHQGLHVSCSEECLALLQQSFPDTIL